MNRLRVESSEFRPAPGSFPNPLDPVTHRPPRPASFAQLIDVARYFDDPSLQPEAPEIRRSEVFLRPSGEHRRGQTPRRSPVIGAENRGLAAARVQLADLAQP